MVLWTFSRSQVAGHLCRTALLQRSALHSRSTSRLIQRSVFGFSSSASPRRLLDRFPKAFQRAEVEAGRYTWWRENGFMRSGQHVRKTPPPGVPDRFSMILPPPNVTGALHIGHSLTGTIQDIMARWHRMHGSDVAWIPGLDHAGIATQTVVERRLLQSHGLDRHALGRERFLEYLEDWRSEYSERIQSQLARMGVSVDWDQDFFTLDTLRSQAVNAAFQRLFREGHIYRASRIVNWCPHLRTALSDVEVDLKLCDGPTNLQLPGRDQKFSFGRGYEIRYRVEYPETTGGGEGKKDHPETLVIFTTRPETMFGDVAVGVHPEDPRYAHLLQTPGVMVRQPITNRCLPVIGDPDLVDPELGSGVVKITPAHDHNDYTSALRNGLPILNIMNDDGTLIQDSDIVPKEFQGMDRLDARILLLRRLKETEDLLAVKPHTMTLALCSRSGDVLEPIIRPQWWLSCKASGMAAKAAEAVQNGDLILQPKGVGHEETWKFFLSQ